MKRFLLTTLILLLLLAAATTCAFAAPVSLKVNGKLIETDVPPYIIDGRTMVPFRAVGEALNAEVYWNQTSEMATFVWEGNRVQVVIDSKNAFVNGEWKTLDVEAELKNSRTMIPVRFVAENLGCFVDWDQDTWTVIINSPSPASMEAKIQTLSVNEIEGGQRVTITANKEMNYVFSRITESSAQPGGTQSAVDQTASARPAVQTITIQQASLASGNAVLSPSFSDLMQLTSGSNKYFGSIVCKKSETEDAVEVTIPLTQKVAGQLSFSEDEKTLYIDFLDSAAASLSAGTESAVDANGLPLLNWKAEGKIVAIDPGHGGYDGGSVGRLNGKQITEKSLILPAALRLRQLLEEAGLRVVMTREEDEYMYLYKRAPIANEAHADILVSVHNNSNSTKSVKGTEIHYCAKESEEPYGLTSLELAGYVLDGMTTTVNRKGRGVVHSPSLAMINRTLMPAVIIEGLYMSNAQDLAIMADPSYIENYARGAAMGIINALNASVQTE
ncbi:MAG: hypothetical protein E7223_06750 [Clostridiales bacterium]|nr:hypothetical protein [Clostridiales bacterium]